ncbi:transmembrane protein [Coprinopsis sp. MPI-PUGE-AT-0042]|nr:transmembrane protein [Coprinopsis sp. MPI-PUGE-AT-0042]
MATVLNGAPADSVLKHEEQKGAIVHTFDPQDSPAQKAAAAAAGSEQLKNEKPSNERAVSVSNGTNGQRVIPTIQIQDHDGDAKVIARDTEQVAEDVQLEAAGEQGVPGAIPSSAVGAIPDWYIVGWRQAAGLDKAPVLEGEEKDKGILEQYLSEQFYGSWYHNAAVIVLAVFVSHFFTRFGFGWGSLFVLLAICNTYYTTSMQRFYRNARDDIQRELVKTRLGSEHESADWLNHFMERFWLIYEPVLSATIVSSVDQILSANTPAFLDSLRLTQFTLGTKAPRIDRVRTFPRTDEDIVMMDWAVSFTPTDERDMTKRQADAKVNPKIVLSIRDITFSGLMRVRMKLVSNFPHIQIVDISFMEKPVVDYVLKPLGGDTFGVDIASIPGLSSFIRDTMHSVLGPMMYDPNVFTLNLEQLLSGEPLDSAVGVVQVTVHSARGIKGVKIGGGSPDPYVSISINERTELARTKYKHNTYNPTWVETKYILINNLHERLVLDLFDYNEHRSDQKLGSTIFELSALEEDSVQEGVVGHLLKDGKDRGELRYDVSFFPVLSPDESTEMAVDSSIGIVRLVIHQAKELDHTKSISGELNPLAKVYLSGKNNTAFTTPRLKHTNSPVWETPYEFMCTNKATEVVTIKVIDDRDFLKDPVVGYMSIRLSDLLEAKVEGGRDWFPLSGCKTGRLRVSAQWKPVGMSGSLAGANQYTPPIGVVRLHLDKAVDVKNVEATLGGKSDPYVRVQVRNVTKGRTEVINNNLNPVWDQIVYIPVHSLKESLMLECMDYQHLTKDRSLGSVEIQVSALAKQSEDPKYPYESTGVADRANPIRLDKGNSTKGTLYYKASFIPCLKLKEVKFEDKNALPSEDDGDDDGDVALDKNPLSPLDHSAPVPLTIKSKKRSNPKISTDVSDNGEAAPLSAVSTDFTLVGGPESATGSRPATPTTAFTTGTASPPEAEGEDLSHEELLSHQSGIIVFHVISGDLEKKGRIEVLVDDGYWPCFSTERARSHNAQWDFVGEGFMKESDFGQVWLRLNEADEGDKDAIVCEWKGPAKDFLKDTLRAPVKYSLLDRNGDRSSYVTVEARYIPVPVTLEARESANNQGIVRVDLLDGHDIRGVDRGGKSDPFVVFTLNGQKVYKSETKKKTLTPEWDESFEMTVPSRVAADFQLEVYDWNQIEAAKLLGVGTVDLASIEAFEATEIKVPLATPKHGEKGYVNLRLVFRPEIIAKQRQKTSTFSTAGRAMTQIGGLPVSAGKGVFHGVTGVFKKDKDRKSDDLDDAIPDVPTGQASHLVGAPGEALTSGLTAFPNLDSAASNEPGTLKVTIIDAKDLASSDVKPYVVVRVGDKEHKTKHAGKTSTPEWNESFKFSASRHQPKIYVTIFDHKTLGKDKELADGEADIWRHIKPGTGTSAADVVLELRQGGLLRLRLEFDAASQEGSSGASVASSGDHGHGISRLSAVSPSRFSLHRKRATDDD